MRNRYEVTSCVLNGPVMRQLRGRSPRVESPPGLPGKIGPRCPPSFPAPLRTQRAHLCEHAIRNHATPTPPIYGPDMCHAKRVIVWHVKILSSNGRETANLAYRMKIWRRSPHLYHYEQKEVRNTSTDITEYDSQNDAVRDSVIQDSYFLPAVINFRNKSVP